MQGKKSKASLHLGNEHKYRGILKRRLSFLLQLSQFYANLWSAISKVHRFIRSVTFRLSCAWLHTAPASEKNDLLSNRAKLTRIRNKSCEKSHTASHSGQFVNGVINCIMHLCFTRVFHPEQHVVPISKYQIKMPTVAEKNENHCYGTLNDVE